MAKLAVVTAVEARLAAAWTLCPIIGGLSDDDRPASTDGTVTPFIAIQYPVANAEQLTLGAPGANFWREEGAFRIVIHVARGAGATGLAWADEVAALYRGKNFDGVQTFAPSSPAIDDRNDDGLYLRLSFAVPYWHDYVG